MAGREGRAVRDRGAGPGKVTVRVGSQRDAGRDVSEAAFRPFEDDVIIGGVDEFGCWLALESKHPTISRVKWWDGVAIVVTDSVNVSTIALSPQGTWSGYRFQMG